MRGGGSSGETRDETVSFLINFGIGTAVFLSVLIIYDLLRFFFPGHCYCRSFAADNPANNNYDGSPLKSPDRPSAYPLSWVISTLKYPIHELLASHGLDAAMYMRFLLTQTRIFFALTVFSAIVLIPTYATADEEGVEDAVGMQKASLANIAAMSKRLWVTLFSEIAVVFIILMFLYRDMLKYTHWRIQYRKDSTNNPSNFAILIMDIPSDSRDSTNIFSMFNRIFPGQVVAVHNVRDAHHLLSLKTRYVSAVNKKQRAQLSSAASNSPRSPRSECVTPDAGIYDNASNHGDESKPCSYPPLELHSDNMKQGEDVIESKLDGKGLEANQSAVVTFSASTDFEKQGRGTPCQMLKKEFYDIKSNEEKAEPQYLQNSSSMKSIRRSSASSQNPSPRLHALTRTDSDNMAQFNRQVNRARGVLEDIEKDIEHSAPVTHAVFVVFRSKVAATNAVTSPIFPSTGFFKIARAPDPRAINWSRINISRYTARIRQYISFAVLTASVLFWVIPSSFIQGLGNLEELGKTLAASDIFFLQNFVEKNENFAHFLEGVLPPILLFLVLLAIPQLMRFVVSFERIPSRVQAENKVRNFLFFFYVMSNFVYQVFFGTLWKTLEDIVEDPRRLVHYLSTNIPAQATFLMKYVLINSFLGSVMGLLNMGRLLFRPFIVWRAKTERDKIQADRLFADYPYAKMYALCMMISLISYVYATISPIINAVAFLYFALAYLCTKQLLLYSHRPMYEGGGYLFRDAWTGLLIGLYVHQVSMIAIFSLKRAATQGILAIISFVFSIWFTIVCRKRFLTRIEHGALLEQSPPDEEAGFQEEIPSNFVDMYIHPGLKPVEVLENTAMDPTTASICLKSKELVKELNLPPPMVSS